MSSVKPATTLVFDSFSGNSLVYLIVLFRQKFPLVSVIVVVGLANLSCHCDHCVNVANKPVACEQALGSLPVHRLINLTTKCETKGRVGENPGNEVGLCLALQDFFGGKLSPHLRLFLMVRPVGARGLCNCVTAFRVSSSAAGLSCTGLKCHAYYEVNTAKRSFIHVCLLIALFSILVFGCLESVDRSCPRLPHCLLVNSSIK